MDCSERNAARVDHLTHQRIGRTPHGRAARSVNDDELNRACFGFFIDTHQRYVAAGVVGRGKLRSYRRQTSALATKAASINPSRCDNSAAMTMPQPTPSP